MSTQDQNQFQADAAASWSLQQIIDGMTSWATWVDASEATQTTVYSFGFPDTVPDYVSYQPLRDTFVTFSEEYREEARQALSVWSNVADIEFVEINDGSAVINHMGMTSQDYYGSVTLGPDTAEGGDIWLDQEYLNQGREDGSWTDNFVSEFFIHNAATVLGLIPASFDPNDNFTENNQKYSIFGRTAHPDYISDPDDPYFADFGPTGPQLHDIAAIQSLYGANMSYNADDTIYSWEDGEAFMYSQWDAGGNDTIDASNQSLGVTINLNEGAFSSIGRRTDGSDEAATDNYSIAYGAEIENAIGSDQQDTLIGNAGDNSLQGNGGNDILEGGDGYDTAVYSGHQSDYTVTIDGEGNYRVGDSPDNMDILTGVESLYFAADDLSVSIDSMIGQTADGLNPIYGSNDDDDIVGTTAGDEMHGEGGEDYLHGGLGNDVLSGGNGYDHLYGEDGDDVLIGGDDKEMNYLSGGAGNDRFVIGDSMDGVKGGDGQDTLLLAGTRSDYYFHLESGDDVVLVFDVTATDIPLTAIVEDVELVGFLEGGSWEDGPVETFLMSDLLADNSFDIGGDTDDNSIVGTNDDNIIHGQDGDDNINGWSGADWLVGGAGNDRINGDGGNDLLDGGSGDDYLNGNAGNDVVDGGDGNDTIRGSDGNDVLIGGLGNDTLVGETGNDLLIGGDGNDILSGYDGDDNLNGWDGDDQLWGGAGNDTLWGGYGNDSLQGDDGDDHLDGYRGDDSLYGGAGNDEILGGRGNDTLVGNDGEDSLYGGEDNDILSGYADDDYVEGNEGNDQLWGGDGNDILKGGTGDDALQGDAGDDNLEGGDGIDSLYGGSGNDILHGGAGIDTLRGDNGDDKLYGEDGDDNIAGGQGRDILYGGSGNDILDGGDDADDIYGDEGDDWLKGGAGDDYIYDSEGNNILSGGLGDDILSVSEGTNVLYGNEGNDTLYGGRGADELRGGTGDDFLEGYEGADSYYHHQGDGFDIINQINYVNSGSTPATDVLKFADMTDFHNLWFSQDGNDLAIQRLDSGETVAVTDWFTSIDYYQYRDELDIEAGGQTLDYSDINGLVDAMAAFSGANPGTAPADALDGSTQAELDLLAAIDSAWTA